MAENGIENVLEFVGAPQPDMYSMALSLFVLDAGIKLLEQAHRDILYLSLTDYVQHKCAPDDEEARRFYREIDHRFGRLAELGAVVALTADHGMSDKSDAQGRPNVIWLQDILDRRFGKGESQVICPITDAFVAHHGALGGFVRAWCRGKVTARDLISEIRDVPGIEEALDRETACARYELPADCGGDVAVIAAQGVCIGTSAADHDLSGLAGTRRRAHGGLSEATVPFILFEPLNEEYRRRAACYRFKCRQMFDFALNGTMQ